VPRTFPCFGTAGRSSRPSGRPKYQGQFVGASAARDFLAAITSGKAGRKKSIGDNDAGCILDAGNRLSSPRPERRPGDRYHPLGAPGGKKLKEILRAKGVPEDERGFARFSSPE